MASRNDLGNLFEREISNLIEVANSRPNGRVRVMVELALDPSDRVDIVTRTRNPRAEAQYNAAVTRRQDQLANALGARFARSEAGYINRINGLPFVSLLLDASELSQLAKLPVVASVAQETEGMDFLRTTVGQVHADWVHSGGNTGSYRMIDVPGTRYIRVRACNGVSCGAWKLGNQTATYYNGCL